MDNRFMHKKMCDAWVAYCEEVSGWKEFSDVMECENTPPPSRLTFEMGFTACHDMLMPLLLEAMPHVTSADTLLDGYRWSKVADSLFVERLREVIPDTCRKCGGEMREGVAMGQTVTGIPDFIGIDEVCTVSPGGAGKVIDCMKCVKCGCSVTL